ncbi:unnamed protein product [Ambrosiozyma monospora]|uniref:Unnamed protein product n=1 Tax=Ambrosiozyma monospora TaxID=43982 RepID=A0ACB5TTF5_AMBMO|nr:unnamed protein product [Ambrosiozyma monospora]
MTGWEELHHFIIDGWKNLSYDSKLQYIKSSDSSSSFTVISGDAPESVRIDHFREDILHSLIKFLSYIGYDNIIERQHRQPFHEGLFPEPCSASDLFVGSYLDFEVKGAVQKLLIPIQVYEIENASAVTLMKHIQEWFPSLVETNVIHRLIRNMLSYNLLHGLLSDGSCCYYLEIGDVKKSGEGRSRQLALKERLLRFSDPDLPISYVLLMLLFKTRKIFAEMGDIDADNHNMRRAKSLWKDLNQEKEQKVKFKENDSSFVVVYLCS